MNFPLTSADVNSWYVCCESIDGFKDSADEWAENLSLEEIIIELFTIASNSDSGNFSVSAFCYDDDASDDMDAPALLTLSWSRVDGFSFNVAIQYPFNTYHDIAIDNVPLKKYGNFELPDIDMLVEIGLNFFNNNFDFDSYKKEVY